MIAIISGPTGAGKTELGLKLSSHLRREAVNMDPYQFYREIPVISNQPKETEMTCLGFRSLSDPFNAGSFAKWFSPQVKPNQIWVGTGLYLGAALHGLDEDRRKGTPFQGPPLHPYKMIVLDADRAELYDRLNHRVDDMIQKGAMKEAETILEMKNKNLIAPDNPVLRAIGLHHLLQVLEHQLTMQRAVETWKQDTRNLAKRQWTWLRKFCAPSNKTLWTRQTDLAELASWLS